MVKIVRRFHELSENGPSFKLFWLNELSVR